MKPFNYTKPHIPEGYACSSCGAHGIKLWREYQTFADHTTLECVDCACASQGRDASSVDERGRILENLGRSDAIGWRVPAVPTEDGDGYWGYASVPGDGASWWRALPNRLP